MSADRESGGSKCKGGVVHRRMAWLAGTFTACALAIAAPATAQSESLKISAPGTQAVGQPLTITVNGVADGSHRLYVYADEGRFMCASDPYHEYYKRPLTVALSGAEGEALAVGNFDKTYTYTPTFQLPTFCAYLDDTPYDTPDVAATASDPVNEYLESHEEAQSTGSRTGVLPGAIEPLPVNPQTEKEYWERVQAEARQRREREQARQPTDGHAIALRCRVPDLRGHTLSAARRALRAAHCKLGSVTIRHGGHGELVVTAQSPAHGRRLRNQTAVSVTLGRRRH
jgi:hypothetical protein